MLPPESAFKKKWNALVVFLVIYNTLFIVLVVCFNKYQQSTGLYWYDASTRQVTWAPMVIDVLVDLVFLADIILTFRTTFFDAENELVLDKHVIRMNYLKTWFLVRSVAYMLPGCIEAFSLIDHPAI